MKCAIEIESFVCGCKLPDGFRFKDWDSSGCLVAFSPDDSGKYITTHLIGIERVSDGKIQTFEISSLKNQDGSSLERGKIFLIADTLVKAVDEAVSKLEAA